jgi:hypothetical protein
MGCAKGVPLVPLLHLFMGVALLCLVRRRGVGMEAAGRRLVASQYAHCFMEMGTVEAATARVAASMAASGQQLNAQKIKMLPIGLPPSLSPKPCPGSRWRQQQQPLARDGEEHKDVLVAVGNDEEAKAEFPTGSRAHTGVPFPACKLCTINAIYVWVLCRSGKDGVIWFGQLLALVDTTRRGDSCLPEHQWAYVLENTPETRVSRVLDGCGGREDTCHGTQMFVLEAIGSFSGARPDTYDMQSKD